MRGNIELRFLLAVVFAFTACSTGNAQRHRLIGEFKLAGVFVYSVNRSPVEDCPVYLRSIGKGNRYHTKTDSLGRYQTDSIATGEYHLIFGHKKHSYLDTVLTITESATFDAVLQVKCLYDANRAARDIDLGKPLLLLMSGFAGTEYTADDYEFERDYGVKYYDFGCTPDDDPVCWSDYNQAIFRYLDSKFGHDWRSEVRRDVRPITN